VLIAPASMAQTGTPAQQPVQAQIVIPPEDPDNFLVGWFGAHFNNGLSEAGRRHQQAVGDGLQLRVLGTKLGVR